MPLWSIFHPAGTFTTDETRRALSQEITKLYTAVGLPAFYVVVNFHELQDRDTYVGGEQYTHKPFIRFVIKQIAVRLPNDDAVYLRQREKIDRAIKPFVADQGYDWEFHVEETERRLWRINGIDPPPFQSAEEKKWFDDNKTSEWQ